jgi:hypothetical protein
MGTQAAAKAPGLQEGVRPQVKQGELRPRVMVLLRNFKFRVAGCVLLALMSVLWSHSLYAAGWRPGGGGSVGKRGILRTFRIRCAPTHNQPKSVKSSKS